MIKRWICFSFELPCLVYYSDCFSMISAACYDCLPVGIDWQVLPYLKDEVMMCLPVGIDWQVLPYLKDEVMMLPEQGCSLRNKSVKLLILLLSVD